MLSNTLPSGRNTAATTKRKLSVAVASAVTCLGMATTGQAFQFETTPDWEVRWDNTVRYNAMFRVEKSDSKLDSLNTPLFDDATL
jgi:hypothetical protein